MPKERDTILQGQLQTLIRHHPGWVIAIVGVLTLVFGYGALRITVSTDLTNFFSEDDPRVVLFTETSDTFGGASYVMAAVQAEEVFSLGGLQALDDLTRRLDEIPGVESVRSITSVEEIRGNDWGIEVSPMLQDLPQDQDEVEAFRRKVQSDSQLAGRLVSEDGRYALVLVQLERSSNKDRIVNEIRAVIEESRDSLEAYLTGNPVLTQVMNKALRQDLLWISPLVILLIMCILYASFRSWQGVLLPLLTMIISTVWTLGLMGFVRIPITQLSAILPAVFTSVGSAYGIHVLHRYRGELRNASQHAEAVTRTVGSVGWAVAMSGATTAAGFLSNAFSSIVRIREFGMFTAFGVLVALVMSLAVIPAILVLVGKDAQKAKPAGNANGGDSALLARLGTAVAKRRATVAAVVFTIALVAALGLPRLTTETDFINFFDKASPTRVAFDLVQEHFGGVDTIQLVVDGDIVEPEVLQAIEEAQEKLRDIPHLGTPLSVVDIVKRVSRVLHADDPAFERIPDTRQEVAQYLLLLSVSGDTSLSQLLTLDYQQTKMEIMTEATTGKERQAMLAQVETVAGELAKVPGVERVQVTGLPILGQAMADLITFGQVQSLILSLVAVFLLVWPIVGSALGSLVCLVPIIITILINFGVMGWVGIHFNVVTALVTSVAVGMGIDYSIHMYTRYQEERKRGLPAREAIAVTTATTGYAVLLNAGAVAAGFLVLTLSAFQPLRVFGALIATTMAVSSLCAVTVLPALLLGVQVKEGRKSPAAAAKSRA